MSFCICSAAGCPGCAGCYGCECDQLGVEELRAEILKLREKLLAAEVKIWNLEHPK